MLTVGGWPVRNPREANPWEAHKEESLGEREIGQLVNCRHEGGFECSDTHVRGRLLSFLGGWSGPFDIQQYVLTPELDTRILSSAVGSVPGLGAPLHL